jgi:WD40 repeat protein
MDSDKESSKTAGGPAHQGPVIACVFLGRPERLATGSIEGAVVVWDVEAAAVERRIAAHTGPVFALVWDEAGTRLISAGHDRRILAIDPLGEAEPEALGMHEGGVFALAIAPDGEMLASAGYDRAIRLWRLADAAPLGVLVGHNAAVLDLDFLPDGALASCGRDNQVIVWDLDRRAERLRVSAHTRWPMRVRAARDGATLCSAGEDGLLAAWDTRTGDCRWRRSLPAPIWGLGLTSDGAGLIAGMGGGVLGFDLRPAGAPEPEVLAPETARAIAACDAGLMAMGADADRLLLYQPRDEKLQRLETGAQLSAAVAAVRLAEPASDDAPRFAAVINRHEGGVVFERDAVRRPLEPGHQGLAFAACTVGADLFATAGFDGQVHLRRAKDGSLVRSVAHGGFVFSIGADAAGTRLLASGHDRLSLWDPRSGERLWARDQLGIGFHLWAALSVDGAQVLAGGEGPELHLWRFGAAEPAHRIVRLDQERPIGTCGLMGMAFLGDQSAAVGNSDGEVRRVDLATGRSTLLHAVHEGGVRAMQVSSDGRRLLSYGENGLTAVYDLAEGRVCTPPAMGGGAVPAATFTAEGDLVWVDGLGTLHALPHAMSAEV